MLMLDLAEMTAQRDSLLIVNERLNKQVEKVSQEMDFKEVKHKNLKTKSKSLLNKHRVQNDERRRLLNKLSLAKRVLKNIDQLCQMHEKNHAQLMNYFGGQVEVLGRLLATFMGNEYQGPILAIDQHQKLTQWFCNVHSVLVWTQRQLVALGERLWIEGFSIQPSKKSKLDINTLSDISHSLGKEEDDLMPCEMIKVLENQQSMLQITRESVNELKDVLNDEQQQFSEDQSI